MNRKKITVDTLSTKTQGIKSEDGMSQEEYEEGLEVDSE